ncbi:helix-turn-helix domain-containing protein [Candidatus Woesearchaeota archaeon]|nr:helix-turn-helix domain-containing protein [Candidatus Woesearchaeota archaeon]
MFKVQFAITHEGCWGSEIHTKFPQYEFSSIDCRWVKGNVAHILLVRGNQKEFPVIVQYLRKRRDVVEVEELSQDDQSLHLRVTSRKNRIMEQFSDMFFENNCFPLASTRFEKNKEIWTLGSAHKENITKVYEQLKAHHPVSINSSGVRVISDLITQKQREALTSAYHLGYYEWPRGKSIQEICEVLKVPKTVFLSHLRKAEQKVMKEFMTK